MIIKRLKLENIRSYTNQEINFPIGSTLLAGNVGSGKSTILLAIDFALFGLQKGNITGTSLLRSDSDKGNVELEIELEDKIIIIKRMLKKEGDKIIQDSGSITIDGIQQKLTAVEIKQKILELLNYPKELLTKSKSIIYRYTVYTPQEEMKHILMAEKDVRLDILRKIFGIDKYKRIKDNSKIFISHLKEKKKEFSGSIYDLEEKMNKKIEYETKLNQLKKELLTKETKLENINKIVNTRKEKIKEIEEQINNVNKLKNEFSVNETDLRHKSDYKERYTNEIKLLEEEIKDFKEEQFDIKTIKNKLDEQEKNIKRIEIEIKNLSINISEFKINKRNSEGLVSDILKLNHCPTCKQEVSDNYKNDIKNNESTKIESYDNKINELNTLLDKKESEFINGKKDIDFLQKQEQSYNLYKIKLENNLERKNKLEKIKLEITNLDLELEKLKEINKNLVSDLVKHKDINDDYENLRRGLELNQQEQKTAEFEKISIQKESENLVLNINILEKEIKTKLEMQTKVKKYTEMQNWLEDEFSVLIENMEKQIMFKIYHDFNNLFQKWFNTLIDNDILTIKLDYEFTPIIQQNNYDIDYEFISGGERTAAALAYRLALNQVINNLITNIKTKDLLILDEPTDGFSSEQLDKIRMVLDELNVKQIIIVSHDQKIESFVDNIIRLNKNNHITSIV
ncbi:MAG: AAA family ATPase [Candidatus Nanoarchaeia archaeon]|nr:AAA family ATPase [Candidatus Nanoarchaeia archaeon]